MSFLAESIIYSKIYPPKIHDKIIFRENLHEILNSGLSKKLTYISSPAGFGKTTLLAEWSKKLNRPVAWINLSEYENDLKTFFKYFIISIQENINPNFGVSALKEINNNYFDVDKSINLIINDFMFFPNDYLVVIDNYQFISENKIIECVSFIINNLPNNVHLFISSKTKDKAIKYAKLRANDELAEIDTEHLRFSSEHLECFYKSRGLKISEQNLEKIEKKTEGWILSIQLSSFFIKDSNFYEEFDNKFIIEYVFEEVLEKIEPETLLFLIKTSILSKFNYELCNHINEISNSDQIISYLDKNNIFITPIDHKGNYYRFHNLFSEILLKKLKQLHPNSFEINIRKKAYEWYIKNNFINEALEQAFILEKEEQILELLDNIIYSSTEVHINEYYIKYMNKISLDKIIKYPKLCFSYLQYLIYTFKLEKSEELINFIESNDYVIDNNLKTYILFSKAYKNFLEENIDKSLEYIKLCINSNKNKKDLFMLSNCYIALSSIYLRKSFFSEALAIMNKGLTIYKKSDSSELEITSDMLFILITLNRFAEAEEKCNYLSQKIEKIKFSFNYESIKTKYLLAQINIYFYQNRDFNHLIESLVKFLKNNENLALLSYAYMSLANIYISLRKFDEAEVFINSVEIIENESVSTDLIFLKARLNLYQDKPEIAKNMFVGLEADLEVNTNPDLFLIMIHTYIVLNELDKAKLLVDNFFNSHPEKESIYVIYNLIFKSVISFLNNSPKGAPVSINPKEELLQQESLVGNTDAEHRDIFNTNKKEYVKDLVLALKLSQKSNIISIFSDFSDSLNHSVNEMLAEFSKKNRSNLNPVISNNYIEQILINFYQKSKRETLEKESHNLNLTKREIELLEMLEKRFTNNEICEKFYVSINTIKTHIKNIYKKLGVKNREEAILKYKAISSM